MKPSVGQKAPPMMLVPKHRRIDQTDVLDADLGRLVQSLGSLHLEPRAQAVELGSSLRQPQVSGRQIARVQLRSRPESAGTSPAPAATAGR